VTTIFTGTAVLAWSLALLLFALHSAAAAVLSALAVALIASALAAILRPMQGLILLPFPALMGPIFPLHVSGLGILTAADIHLLGLCIVFVLIDRKTVEPVFLGRGRLFLYGFAIFFLLSWALSEDLTSSNYALANFVQLAAVYLLTLNLLRSANDVRALLTGWLVAVSLCSLLTLLRYYQGEPLLLSSELLGEGPARDDLLLLDYFFRATFFYAGFFFALAVTLIVVLSRLAGGGTLHPLNQVLLMLSGLINATALLLMNTKSAIYSILLIGPLVILGGLARGRRNANRPAGTAPLVAGLVVITVGLVVLVPLFLVSEQLTALSDRLTGGESFAQRMTIYRNAVQEMLSDEKLLVLGLGPDTIVRSPQLPRVSRILTDPLTGLSEGALDSTFLTVLVEFGLVAFMALGSLVAFTMWLLFAKRSVLPVDIYWAIAGGMAVWLLTASTQYMGWSKTSWLFAELVAMAHFLTRSRLSAKLVNRASEPGATRPQRSPA